MRVNDVTITDAAGARDNRVIERDKLERPLADAGPLPKVERHCLRQCGAGTAYRERKQRGRDRTAPRREAKRPDNFESVCASRNGKASDPAGHRNLAPRRRPGTWSCGEVPNARLILPNCRIAPEEARHFSFERIEIHRVRAVLRRSGRDRLGQNGFDTFGRLLRPGRPFVLRGHACQIRLGPDDPGSGCPVQAWPVRACRSGLASSGLAGSAGRIVGGAGSVGGRSCDLGSELAIRSPRTSQWPAGLPGARDEIRRNWSEGCGRAGLMASTAPVGTLPRQVRLIASSARLDRLGRCGWGSFADGLKRWRRRHGDLGCRSEAAFRHLLLGYERCCGARLRLDCGGAGGSTRQQPGAAVPWWRAGRGYDRRVERRWASTAGCGWGRGPDRRTGRLHIAEPGTAHRAWPHRPEHWSGADAKAAAFLRVAGAAAGMSARGWGAGGMGAVSDRCRSGRGGSARSSGSRSMDPGAPRRICDSISRSLGPPSSTRCSTLSRLTITSCRWRSRLKASTTPSRGCLPRAAPPCKLSRAPASLRSTSAKIAEQ